MQKLASDVIVQTGSQLKQPANQQLTARCFLGLLCYTAPLLHNTKIIIYVDFIGFLVLHEHYYTCVVTDAPLFITGHANGAHFI